MKIYVEWLRPPDDECDNLYIEESEDKNDLCDAFKENIRPLLPKHWQEFIGPEASLSDCDDHVLRLISEVNCCSLKTLYVKIVIAYCLFDANNSFVRESINWLFEQVDKQWSRDDESQLQLRQHIEENIALEVLSFLHHYYGVDVN